VSQAQPADYGCILFDATQAAIRAEKVLKRAGFLLKLIPVPRELSSDCGVCARFLWQERTAIEAALVAAGVETAGVHHLESLNH